jgi:hypothetical protein
VSASYWDAEEAKMQAELHLARIRLSKDSGKKSYEPDPKPVKKPKKGKRK